MDQDDLLLFRPRLGGSASPEKVSFKQSILQQSKAQKGSLKVKRSSGNRGGHVHRGRTATYVRSANALSRRVVVKARIVQMRNSGQKAADLHIQYIERDGVEKDGSKGTLYGRDDSFDKGLFTRSQTDESHQFRFILSPEDASELDLTDLTKRLMETVEDDLQRDVEWAAVNHYNTDNPHTHIVVRGLDAKGNELRISRDYISNGVRNRAREIVTKELGLRTEWEIEKQLNKEVSQERLTSLDHTISKIERLSTVDLGQLSTDPDEQRKQNRLKARLDTLESLGLAHPQFKNCWHLQPNWKAVLKTLGERGDIIKSLHREMGGDLRRYRIIDPKSKGQLSIEGRLVRKGLSDELYDKHYYTVETHNGHLRYLELPSSIDITEHKEGDIVRIKLDNEQVYPGKKMSIIRESRAPLSEQIGYSGRTWLDKFTDRQNFDDFSTQGFGSELRKAVIQRVKYVRALGIDPSESSRARQLDKIERQGLVKRFQANNGYQRIDPESQPVKGKLTLIENLPSEKRYALITDEQQRQFALVPWRKELARYKDMPIQLAIDDQGKYLVRARSRGVSR